MADNQAEDGLFDRMAKTLGAVRQNPELTQSAHAEGISGGVASAETELSSLATSVEALRQRFEHQQSVTTLLAAAAAKCEAELRTLRQT